MSETQELVLETVITFLTYILRFALPPFALLVVLVCVISLIRNRPRVHKMAKLIDQNSGSEIEIDHWETSIGKSKSNDIVLPLPSVSRFHAVVAKKSKEWVVTDTFSKTGVYLNGEKIEGRHVLEDGDIIQIGTVPLKFSCTEAVSREARRQMRDVANQSRVVAYAVLIDTQTRRPVYLKQKDVLIGRDDGCDIQILSDTVSSEHARIHLTSKGWALSDLDSHNGTKLNGRYLTQPQLIFDEDTITIGDKVFVFYEK